MAFKLFKRLRQQDPETLSPQLRSNLSNMADRVRFREFRRTQGRPGITGPTGLVTGATAPIPSQIAAGRISERLGTEFGSELNRLTAPDPMTFARRERAPEFIQEELAEDRVTTRMTAAEAAKLEQEAPLIAPRGEAEIATLTGAEQRAAAAAEGIREQRDVETEAARLGMSVDELEIEKLKREAAGAPLPEDVRTREAEDRAFEVAKRQREATTTEQERLLGRIDSQIENARLEGDFEKAERLEREASDLVSGFEGPRAPTGTFGGAPVPTGAATPVQIERAAERAVSSGTAAGLLGEGGEFTLLDDIADEQGFPTRNTLSDLETALDSINNALSIASDVGRPSARDILVSKIKISKGYRAVKQRAEGSIQRTGVGLITPFAAPRMLTGSLKPQDLRETQRVAQDIVDVVEGSTSGAPPIR